LIAFVVFSKPEIPASVQAMRAIWRALERLEDIPELGQLTEDERIRQILVRFGRRGCIVRYRVLPPHDTIFVIRLWHSRERRE
jgi:plasmid stabilization system protein ParE